MRCTKKLKQDGNGAGITLHFASADLESMAILVCQPEDAEKFKLGMYYDFEASPQKSRWVD